MATPAFGNQPVLLQGGDHPDTKPEIEAPRPRESWFAFTATLIASVIAVLWIGGAAAWFWGYFGSSGLLALDIQQVALFSVATFLPPVLFLAVAWTLARSHAMGLATEALVDATDRLFTADETATRTAQRDLRAAMEAAASGADPEEILAAYERTRS